MAASVVLQLLDEMGGSLSIVKGAVHVTDLPLFRQKVGELARISALETGERQKLAQFLIRAAAYQLGIHSTSIHELYIRRGMGHVPNTFTVPAFNLRVLPFDAARAAFRVARRLDAGAFIFELSRAEMSFTNQSPLEYVSSILAAGLAEGYRGPVFIQGDHFQVSARHYRADRNGEMEALKALIRDSIAAGFLNIDIDTSTLVDLSQSSIPAQQALNARLTAMLTTFIRKVEPDGMTVSIGGEIGEVGGTNSTEAELRAYLSGYEDELNNTGAAGLSKVSIQTGTTHGGVVLTDGSIAQVNVDFDTMRRLSELARSEYGLGGAVQHGASTLPEDAFGKFVEAGAVEIHLATSLMNTYYDMIPEALRSEMYERLSEKNAADRTPGMTEEQFRTKFRKLVVGDFKAQAWDLPEAKREAIGQAWEKQFEMLFTNLGLKETRQYTDRWIKPVSIAPDLQYFLGEKTTVDLAALDVTDLAD